MSPEPWRPPTPSQQYRNAHTYIPPRVQREMERHMQHAVPASMRKYAGAYLEQRTMPPGMNPGSGPPAPHAPTFHMPRQSVSHQARTQAAQTPPEPPPAAFAESPPAPAAAGQVVQPAQPGQNDDQPADPKHWQPPEAQHTPYDFIVNPDKPPRRPFTLPGGNSLPLRIAYAAGGLLVLVIIIAIIKNAAGGGNFTPIVTVAQDQQELIHLTTDATQAAQQGQTLSPNSQNFAITAQLTLASAQTQLLTYLSANGTKVNTKTLNLRLDPEFDSQLTTAGTDGTYDQTFQQIMQNAFGVYEQSLKQAYTTAGPNGRQLLSQNYNAAQLLLTQLNSPAG